MKKIVLKFDYSNEKMKRKGMKKVSSISGVESMAVDASAKKLTITGDVDPVVVVDQLRKLCAVDIVSFGPAKEPEASIKIDEVREQWQQGFLPPYFYYYQPTY